MSDQQLGSAGQRGAYLARTLCVAAAFFGTCSTATTGWAAPPASAAERVEGRVVAFELGQLVVDVAADRGAVQGATLELWRPLNLKHPVTGQVVSDRFLIGRLRLTQVRGALSLARADGKLEQAAQPGDIVVLRHAGPIVPPSADVQPELPAVVPAPVAGSAPPAAPANASSTEPAKLQASRVDAPLANDAAEVSALFEGLRGKNVVRRIVAYEGYVSQRPRSRYAQILYEEAVSLRRLLTLEKRLSEHPESVLRHFVAPTEARAHTPLTLALEVGPGPVAVMIHSRNAGEVAYRSAAMKRVGEGYFSATISAERVNAPSLQYFLEGVNAEGQAVPVLGSADDPESTSIVEVPSPAAPLRRPATVSLATDYADWNNFKGNDVVWQTEGSFGMRFQDVGLRAARTGFGVYRGKGGSLDELDQQKLSGRSVGLTYGYLEGEWGLSHFTSLLGRMVIGLEDDGVNGGAQILLRLGNDRETNLTIGGEVLGGIGVRGITELQLASFPRVPILFRTEVTNQPAGVSRSSGGVSDAVSSGQSEVGARAIAQVGYRFLPDLVIAVRGSYQGRTINHAGPGFGGAVTYQW